MFPRSRVRHSTVEPLRIHKPTYGNGEGKQNTTHDPKAIPQPKPTKLDSRKWPLPGTMIEKSTLSAHTSQCCLSVRQRQSLTGFVLLLNGSTPCFIGGLTNLINYNCASAMAEGYGRTSRPMVAPPHHGGMSPRLFRMLHVVALSLRDRVGKDTAISSRH